MSTYLVLEQYLREHGAVDERAQAMLGEAVAGWWGIRALSLSVARLLDAGQAPVAESALVKELGTRFEQDVLDAVWRLVPEDPDPEAESLFERLLASWDDGERRRFTAALERIAEALTQEIGEP